MGDVAPDAAAGPSRRRTSTRPDAKDPLVCSGAALRKAGRRLAQLYDSVLAPCGLTISQRSILWHVLRAGSSTTSELASAMILDRAALARCLRPLERHGYLRRTQDDAGTRHRRVCLTPAGRAKLAEVDLLWKKAQTRFEEVYGLDRSQALRLALSEIFSDQFAAAFRLEREAEPPPPHRPLT